MKAGMTKDWQELTVHSVSFARGRGSVLYASLPIGPSASASLGRSGAAVAGDRHSLVSALWDDLAAMERPLWKHCQSSGGDALPIQVVHGRLGRPRLLLGEHPGPAISFSEGGGKLWAALCGEDSDIGIDVAGPDEFEGEYPFNRVFHPQELQHASRLTDGDLEQAAALVWSVKEAVVKALGCAFHLVDPREVTVYPPEESAAEVNGVYTFPVGLSGKALLRVPNASARSLRVRSFAQRKMWLSIALLNRRSTGHE